MDQGYYDTIVSGFRLKKATEEDIPTLLELIRGLAAYEHMEEDVIATEESVKEYLCDQKLIECYIGIYQNQPVGYILIFYNFSTFTGKPGLYLEDLYIKPEFRKMGFGKAALIFLAKRAKEKDCKRFEWTCLKWNEPSKQFYESMGAVPMDEWMIYRVTGENLEKLADNYKEEIE